MSHPIEEWRLGAHLPSLGLEPVGLDISFKSDAWPVRREAYGRHHCRVTGTKRSVTVLELLELESWVGLDLGFKVRTRIGAGYREEQTSGVQISYLQASYGSLLYMYTY